MQQITITITVTPAQATLLHAGAAATGLPLAEALLRPIPQENATESPQNRHRQMKLAINTPTEKPLAVIPLTPEQRAAITSKAKAAGLSEAQYLSRFLTQAINAARESNQISTDK